MYPLYNQTIQDNLPEELKKALAEIKKLSEQLKAAEKLVDQYKHNYTRTGGGY